MQNEVSFKQLFPIDLSAFLIDRSTRKIALTESGRELLPLFSKIIEDLDAALLNLADHTNLTKGVVRVAAPQLMSCTLLPKVIAAYRSAHPDIQLHLADCAVEDVGHRVHSGEADIGIGPEREPGTALASTLLFEQTFALVFPRGHALEARKRITWADLAKHPFISLQGQFTERLLSDLRRGVHDAPLRPVHEVTFMTTGTAAKTVRSPLPLAVL